MIALYGTILFMLLVLGLFLNQKKSHHQLQQCGTSNGTELHEWLTVNPLLQDAVYGLFAVMKFEVGDIVSVYLGFVSSKVINEIVHTNMMIVNIRLGLI